MESSYKKRIEFRKEEAGGDEKRKKKETQILLCIKQHVKPNKIK